MPKNPLVWTKSLSTDVASLDEQHQTLIVLLNEFSDAVEMKASLEDVRTLYGRVLEETSAHFAYEEQVMQNIGVRGLSEHKRYHKALLTEALEIKSELDAVTDISDVIPYISFLRAIILKHMSEQDSEIRDHICGTK